MKGGVTSGVIYPSTAVRLSEVYTFRNIGGTSAGAIAAAVTAAAEYGRQTGNPESFQMLAQFPQWIGTNGRLFGMFAPSPSTKPLFALLTAPMQGNPIVTVTGALVRHFLLPLFGALAAAVAIGWWALRSAAGGWGIACALFTALVVFLALFFWRIAALFLRRLPENFYGLSKAFDPKSTRTDGPLINWLSAYLDQLAGKSPDAAPLTFGDLASRQINFEMMTTAVNLGRPYRLPFRGPDRIFYFCPDEFRTLFPERVVAHMIAHAPNRNDAQMASPPGKTLVAFPDPEQLPVVVATRMSLSFPILLAAVPLYAVDFTRTARPFQAERCWFSDGGISSNLPIHFFDASTPNRPTFAINLKQFHPDYPEENEAVWMPMKNNSGWRSEWTRFEAPGAFGSPLGFLAAILNAMQNWQDNMLARVPGYRDRMVSVSQSDEEGGLNLNMDAATVARLSDRGKRAGDLLIQRFYTGEGWPNHIWLRFRSCFQLTAQWLAGLTPADNPQLLDMIDHDPPSYPVGEAVRASFHNGAKAILDAAHRMDEDISAALDAEAPRPEPELRIRPKI